MTQPKPQVLQTYTLLQIAAEAFLRGTEPVDAAAQPGAGAIVNFRIDPGWLTSGNKHSSRMTPTQAAQFAREWEVTSHQPNTATGFSATLFKCLVDDPSRGMVKDRYVVSFRSTEFIEDHGQAWGQVLNLNPSSPDPKP